MPGPPSFWYFRVGGTESAWQQSSCGRWIYRPSRAKPVEAFDDQHLGVSERGNLGSGRRQAKGCHERQAEVLALDAIGQIHAIGQGADRRLQDMGGRRGARWLYPPTIVKQQRGLFLCTRDRDAEIPLGPDARGRATKVFEHGGDLVVTQRLASQYVAGPRHLAFWQELQCTHLIAPDPGQQAVSIHAVRAHAYCHPAADVVAVG